jgi:uncharacterized membrane protein
MAAGQGAARIGTALRRPRGEDALALQDAGRAAGRPAEAGGRACRRSGACRGHPAEPKAEAIAVPQGLTFTEESAESSEAPAPKEPGWLAKLLFGGNILAKIGVVLLIFGVGSALKLAAEFGVLPAEARLGIAALFGVALGVLGWRKRAGHEMFGFALQGGGVAVLYLVVYFALTRYALIGTTAGLRALRCCSASAACCWRPCRTAARWRCSASSAPSLRRSSPPATPATTSCCSPTSRCSTCSSSA